MKSLVPCVVLMCGLLGLPPLAHGAGQDPSDDILSDAGATVEYWGAETRPDDLPAPDTEEIYYDEREGVALQFVDVDVRKVVDAVLGDTLRVSYIIDPAVQGTVTLRYSRRVARASLVPALEAALSNIGVAVVRRGETFVVVPMQTAGSQQVSLDGAGDGGSLGPGYAVEILPLRYGSAREIAKVLGRFARKEAVEIDPGRNRLIVTGTAPERAAIRQVVRSLDVDSLKDMAFAFYPLSVVDPETLVSDLGQIFQPPLDILGSRVRLVPMPRMKAVLGIAHRRDDLQQLEPWIRRLDAGAGGKRQIYVYQVQNGRAKDLADALQQVVSGLFMTTSAQPSGAAPVPGAAPPPATQQALPPTANTMLNAGADTARIVPNEEQNSLLIFATGEEYQTLKDALDKLDVMPRQVLIEAVLAEVTLSNDLRFGLQWFLQTEGGDHRFTLSEAENGSVSSQFPGFSYGFTGSQNARVVLNALQSRTNVRVLSAPKLMVINNQTATLQVGDQVPVITQTSQGISAPDAPLLSTVELRDTGVILKVTPRASDSGQVTLDISQEVSDVVPTTTSGINSPTIRQRRLASTVTTASGRMIALGGLIRENASKGRSGVPLLSDIPLIGNVFRTNTHDNRRTELVVLLTPTVMRDPAEVQETVDEFLEKLQVLRPLVEAAR